MNIISYINIIDFQFIMYLNWFKDLHSFKLFRRNNICVVYEVRLNRAFRRNAIFF